LARILGYKRSEYSLNVSCLDKPYSIQKLAQDLETLSVQTIALRHSYESTLREERRYATILEVEIGSVQLEKEEILKMYFDHVNALKREISEAERQKNRKRRKRKNR